MKKNIQLTPTEEKILPLICRELSPEKISERLKISEKTYFNHRNNLCRKIKAKTNVGLYRYALVQGWVKFKNPNALKAIVTIKKTNGGWVPRFTIGIQTFTIAYYGPKPKKEALWYKQQLERAFANLK